jgi:hypothetical protein
VQGRDHRLGCVAVVQGVGGDGETANDAGVEIAIVGGLEQRFELIDRSWLEAFTCSPKQRHASEGETPVCPAWA